MLILGARRDDLTGVPAAVLTPIPHEERVGTVIGVALPIHLDVARIFRELLLVLLPKCKSIAGLG